MKNFLPFIFFLHSLCIYAQPLQPGFDATEYRAALAMNFQRYDSAIVNPRIPSPEGYHVVYRSPETGLQNRWNMWYSNNNKVAVISLRGSVAGMASWLANYYAAMVPAIGEIQLTDSTRFVYQLAADSAAHVHVGWLVALGHLAPTIVAQIKVAYALGIRECIITGHSQGGALATLTRSYIHYLTQKGELPRDMQYKTYASAAPKCGNTAYVYDFDYINRGGWAFTVINVADWVPETQFSVQTIHDFNRLSPFGQVKPLLAKQKFFVRLFLTHKYNRLRKPLERGQRRFERTLGGMVYKMIKKNVLPQLREPVYAHDNNYQRAGTPVVLMPDATYYTRFPNQTKNIFIHHMYDAYEYLVEKDY